MSIYIDSREKSEGSAKQILIRTIERLSDRGSAEIHTSDVADYIIEHNNQSLLIEYKAGADLFSSVRNNHLQRQSYNMKRYKDSSEKVVANILLINVDNSELTFKAKRMIVSKLLKLPFTAILATSSPIHIAISELLFNLQDSRFFCTDKRFYKTAEFVLPGIFTLVGVNNELTSSARSISVELYTELLQNRLSELSDSTITSITTMKTRQSLIEDTYSKMVLNNPLLNQFTTGVYALGLVGGLHEREAIVLSELCPSIMNLLGCISTIPSRNVLGLTLYETLVAIGTVVDTTANKTRIINKINTFAQKIVPISECVIDEGLSNKGFLKSQVPDCRSKIKVLEFMSNYTTYSRTYNVLEEFQLSSDELTVAKFVIECVKNDEHELISSVIDRQPDWWQRVVLPVLRELNLDIKAPKSKSEALLIIYTNLDDYCLFNLAAQKMVAEQILTI